VILYYYTHTNAGREFNIAELRIEYAGSHENTVVGYLEPTEVSFILNTHFYLIYLGRENN
jgi:predicted AAA+ superfamily ATPase